MGQGDTLLNAVIGAVVSVVLAFLPFSTVLGGGVAGYLQRTTRSDGLRVGAISGLITMLPLVLFGTVFGGAFFMPLFGISPRALFGVGFVLLVTVVLLLVYTVALAAIGGYIGVYIATETDIGS
jgi:hypothetical protein